MAQPTPGGAPAPSFPPPADPPNLIRAQQKDELYLQHLVDACHDGVRRVLGPRAALRWAAETRLAAQLLYYALTTGSGLQTLGEEYCDILQVAGARGSPPGATRRGLLVLLQAAGPYLADRLAAAAGEEDEAEGGMAAWREAQAAAAAAAAGWQQQQQQQQAPGQLQEPAPPHKQLLQRLAAGVAALRRAAQQAAQPVVRHLPAAASFVRQHGATLLRLHLALFYIWGRYYQPAKRAAGVRYVFMGRTFEGRPSYHILGLLLLAQLGISGLLWLLRRHGGLPGLGGGAEAEAAGGRPAGVVLLGEDGKLLPPEEAAGGAAQAQPAAGEVPAGRRCPLCLSARAHPTATPCGHVFCWRCVTEWCAQRPEQPECPLCRAEFRPSDLVVVRHADF